MNRAVILPALAIVLAGCPSTPSDDAGTCSVDAAATTTLTLGNGDPAAPTHFAPLLPGQTVPLAAGSQGSQHVWIQVRGDGICPDHPRIVCTVEIADTGRDVGTSNFSGVNWTAVGGSPGSYFSAPLACRIDDGEYCSLLNGGHVTVKVHVDDTAGHVSDAQIGLTLDGFTPTSDANDIAARRACCADYTNAICWPNGAPDGAVLDAGDASMSDGALDEQVSGGDGASVDVGTDASDVVSSTD